MAFSKSIIKAQNIISCQLCETEPKIKWRCLECELLMCDKCREKIHPKFKNAKDHEIIDIKEVRIQGNGGNKKLDFTNIKCKRHLKQACCIFCSTCNRLACPSCLAEEHTGHEFKEIKEIYDIKLERLKNGQRKMVKDQETLIKGEQQLDQIKLTQNLKCSKTMHDIQTQKTALIKAVNKHADKFSEEVQQKMKKINDSIAKEQMKVQTLGQRLKEQNKKAEDVINSRDTSWFFDEVDELGKSMEKILSSVDLSHSSIPKFVPGEITQSNVGSLQNDLGYDITTSEAELKVIKEFTTELRCIHYIAVGSDGSVWIGDGTAESQVLKKTQLVGDKLKTISTINTAIRGIAVTPSNDLLLSDAESSLAKIRGNTKMTNSVYSVAPLLIMCVHATSDDRVIVGAISDDPTFSSTRRAVIVMDKSGNHQALYEYDRSNKHIFTYPKSITTTSNSNICVLDSLSSDWRGRVVILGQAGDVLNIYKGNSHINTKDQPLKPRDVVTTSSDILVMSDMNVHTIHILNKFGHFITHCNTRNHRIIFPYSLSLTTTGHLFIGCSAPANSSEKAKLYKVELSNC